ncbi:hypothetical protein HPG69_012494 [Diceros bicornis minor]|uniref:Uncharacterized protein n=1 Tax=Diceros bicornis minor TaxID=77932 RepID=A0A7J7F099_DICBM|nr:hypothetical protein HPG69_012494 [Diceros bicornis minor]
MGSASNQQFAGGSTKVLEEPQLSRDADICEWVSVHMGFGFLSTTTASGSCSTPTVDVFEFLSQLHTQRFQSPNWSERVQFTFQKSTKGLESPQSPALKVFCTGSERHQRGRRQRETEAIAVEV